MNTKKKIYVNSQTKHWIKKNNVENNKGNKTNNQHKNHKENEKKNSEEIRKLFSEIGHGEEIGKIGQ